MALGARSVNAIAGTSGLNDMGRNCPREALVKKVAGLVYGIAAYVIFLLTFVYAIGFVGDVAVPKSLDSPATGPWLRAVAIDVGLLSLFALQHSGMARASFKKRISRLISPAVERATFVLASSIALGTLIAFWQPVGGVVWRVADPVARAVLYIGFACGWGVVLLTTFLINHFELFGLQQVWRNLRSVPQSAPAFVTPLFYRVIRHPLYAGFLLAFWCTPTMTSAHLLFAVMTTAYMLVAIQLEERDLLQAHPEYARYRRHVPMLIPGWRGSERSGRGVALAEERPPGSA
jgi:protein-S-isoprenylcysteine O-methyltransferase Ste14